jgi:hypothetical protein
MIEQLATFWRQHQLSDLLGVAPTAEPRAVKKAYAARIKVVRPDDDPIAFQRLRDAYTLALEFANHCVDENTPASDTRPDNALAAHTDQPQFAHSDQQDLARPAREPELRELERPPPIVADDVPPSRRAPPKAYRVNPMDDAANVQIVREAQPAPLRPWVSIAQAYLQLPSFEHATAMAWLYAQPEFDSLTERQHFSLAFQRLCLERALDWQAFSALCEFFDWDNATASVLPGLREKIRQNELANELQSRPVNQRFLSQLRAVPTRRGWLTGWLGFRLFSSDFPAWFLHQRFSWWLFCLSALRPMQTAVNALFVQLHNLHIEPEATFNRDQVDVQWQLRRVGINRFKAVHALLRIFLIPLFYWAVIVLSPLRQEPFALSDTLGFLLPSLSLAGVWLWTQLHQNVRVYFWQLAASGKARQPAVLLVLSAAVAALVMQSPHGVTAANILSVFAVFCAVRHWAAGILLTLGTAMLAILLQSGTSQHLSEISTGQHTAVLLALHCAALMTYGVQLKFPGAERALQSALTPAPSIKRSDGSPTNLGVIFLCVTLLFIALMALFMVVSAGD